MDAFAGDGRGPDYKDCVVEPNDSDPYVSSADVAVARTIVDYAADVVPENSLSLKERHYNETNATASMSLSRSAGDEIIPEDLQADYPKTIEDFARGWIASLFDTDGTFREGKELGNCQYEGSIFDQVCKYLDLLEYE